MLNFSLHNPTKIYFGKGEVKVLRDELRARAKKILIVTGSGSVKKNGIFDDVIEQVKNAGCEYVELTGIHPNPRLEEVSEGMKICRSENVDFILPVGGGSVIDAAKAIAVGAKYSGDVWDFFDGTMEPENAVPVGAVLTLSATGTEMNSNSVISKEDTKRKLALSTPLIQPVFSILDPVYTFTVNKFHTAAGVADIMAHVFEYYLNPLRDTEIQDTVAEALLKICIRFGKVVCMKPDDYNARANIMWASTLALNGTVGKGKISDWTCHAIEHEISAIYDISHGAGLAMILPGFMKVVLEKYGPEKFTAYGNNVWGIEGESTASESIDRTKKFFGSIELPTSLKESDISDEYFDLIANNVVQVRGKSDIFTQLNKQDILKVLHLS